MPNRFVCDVLKEMRKCSETANYSYLAGLIEEAQTMFNRMEARLEDYADMMGTDKDVHVKQLELRKLRDECNNLKAQIREKELRMYGLEKEERKFIEQEPH